MGWDKVRAATEPGYRERQGKKLRDWYQRTGGPTPERRKKINAYHARRRRDPKIIPLLKENTRRYTEKFRLKRLIYGAIKRAEKNGLECDPVFLRTLTEPRPEFCPCCNVRLDYTVRPGASHMPKLNGPSLDRVDACKGYIRGNVVVICWRCNALKRDALLHELEAIIVYMKARL